jgi:hypothetical protein
LCCGPEGGSIGTTRIYVLGRWGLGWIRRVLLENEEARQVD